MKKRILSFLICCVMLAGLLPTAIFAAETDTGKAIQLGVSGISGFDSEIGYDYIYFGNWTAPDSYTASGPIKWRVLDDQTNTGESGLFLLSEVLLGSGEKGNVYFVKDNSSWVRNEWQSSQAKKWCKDFAGESGAEKNVPDAFTSGELDAILATTKSDSYFTTSSGTQNLEFSASENILNGDRVFFLSVEETENDNYGFTDTNARAAYYGTSTAVYWLRSPFGVNPSSPYYAGAIYPTGTVYRPYVVNAWAARPAFNLNLNPVLFSSAAEGGKSAAGTDSGLAPVGIYNGNEWKLTLKDSSHIGFAAKLKSFDGNTAVVSYSGAVVGTNEYISAMVKNGDNIKYYGRIAAVSAANGEISFTMPSDFNEENGDKLCIFNEQYNGDKMTDYAAEPVVISLDGKHVHDWSEDWSKNDTHHWHECTAEDCDVTDNAGKQGYGAHSGKDDGDCTTAVICECGYTITAANSGHSYGEWQSNGDGTHTHYCTVAGCKGYETENCSGGEATCTELAECSFCGGSYGMLKAHSFTAEKAEEQYLKSEATCTAKAVYYKSCADCGLTSKGTDYEATFDSGDFNTDNHTDTTEWIQTATTHTQKYKCCDAIVVAEESHKWENGVCTECEYVCRHSGGEATCTELAECSFCGGSYGMLKAHSFTAEKAEEQYLKSEATCTAKAVYYKSCADCGLTSKGTDYEATFDSGDFNTDNHTDTTEWIQTATTHTQKYKCCDAIVVAEESHKWENGVCTECEYVCRHSGGEATCQKGAECEFCGEIYGEPNPENHSGNLVWIINETQHEKKWDCCGETVISPEDHTFVDGKCEICDYIAGHTHSLTKVEAKPATATEDGNKEYYTCDGCDKWFEDENGTTEITDKSSVTVPATGSTEDPTDPTDPGDEDDLGCPFLRWLRDAILKFLRWIKNVSDKITVWFGEIF
ncbi:MAG: hypothetical protein ACI4JG_10420 [Acutalibacteraceae bacterium]